ncbi:hypothetical protein D3C81_1860370 [compost metagenome]
MLHGGGASVACGIAAADEPQPAVASLSVPRPHDHPPDRKAAPAPGSSPQTTARALPAAAACRDNPRLLPASIWLES